MTGGTRGAAVSEALVKDWVRAPLLHRSPSQQEPCRSMFVQGLVVPLMVQEGRWQVRTYTGAEKLPGRGVIRRGQDRGRQPHLKLHFRGQGHDWVLGLPSSPFLIPGPCLLPQIRAMPPPSDQGHASSLRPGPCLLPQTRACLLPQTRACLLPQTSARLLPQTRAMPPSLDQNHVSVSPALPPRPLPRPSQPLTKGHSSIALEADALVLVTLDPPGLLRGAVLWVDPHAGVAFGAAECRRVGRYQESVEAHSGHRPPSGRGECALRQGAHLARPEGRKASAPDR